MGVRLHTYSGVEIMPSGFPIPRRFPRFSRLRLPQDARIRTPPAGHRENEHTDSGEPNVMVLQTLVPMVVESGPMEYGIYHVYVSEIEVDQLLAEIWRREVVPDGTKMGGLRQMDTFPF